MNGSPASERTGHEALLLRETNHRCANDLQLVVSLLALQSRRAHTAETRNALTDTAARVAILARARAGLMRDHQPDLGTAIRDVCEGLHSQAEPRGIAVSAEVTAPGRPLSAEQVTTLALIVNELATNAIKHAFRDGASGCVSVVVHHRTDSGVHVTVDDDGLPLGESATTTGTGMGLGLVRRLIASVGGTISLPEGRSKKFEIIMPL